MCVSRPPRVDWVKARQLPLEDQERHRTDFQKRLETVLLDFSTGTLTSSEALDGCWESLKTSVLQAAEDVLPKQELLP